MQRLHHFFFTSEYRSLGEIITFEGRFLDMVSDKESLLFAYVDSWRDAGISYPVEVFDGNRVCIFEESVSMNDRRFLEILCIWQQGRGLLMASIPEDRVLVARSVFSLPLGARDHYHSCFALQNMDDEQFVAFQEDLKLLHADYDMGKRALHADFVHDVERTARRLDGRG